MMPSNPFHSLPETDGEAAMVAPFLDFYRTVQRSGKNAPIGQFLNVADATTKEQGQDFLRSMLEHIIQEEINEVEKKTKREFVRPANGRPDTSATVTKPSNPPTAP
jgi:hypothetical protein